MTEALAEVLQDFPQSVQPEAWAVPLLDRFLQITLPVICHPNNQRYSPDTENAVTYNPQN
jgi:hypothetical protein